MGRVFTPREFEMNASAASPPALAKNATTEHPPALDCLLFRRPFISEANVSLENPNLLWAVNNSGGDNNSADEIQKFQPVLQIFGQANSSVSDKREYS
jgi:hypothetical protein